MCVKYMAADFDNGVLSIEGYEANARILDHLLTTDADFAQAFRKLIRKSLQEAKKRISNDIRFSIGANNDPRDAYKAVKMAAYKSIFGGNLSILSRRKAGSVQTTYHAPRTLKSGQRGGNRVKMSARTLQVMSYYGMDRGFILRWLEEGTGERTIKFTANGNREKVNRGSRGGDLSKYGKTINTGTRGKIGTDNVFSDNAPKEMQKAVNEISEAIIEYINRVVDGKQ